MTRPQRPRQTRPAPARQWTRDEMIAQAVRVNGGDGSSYATRPVIVIEVPRRTGVTHQTHRALPSARALKRRARRAGHRLAASAAAGFATALLLTFALMVPATAALGVGAALSLALLTWKK